MRVELRKKNPYFGKYKFKIHVYNGSWFPNTGLPYQQRIDIEKEKWDELKNHLLTNWKSDIDFKWRDGWNTYLRDEDVFNDLLKHFPTYISYVCRPAPGYEYLTGTGNIEERVLWYDKFPYKILLKDVNRNTNHEQLKWCNDNLKNDSRTSSGSCESSFYFMTAFDAMAFKLAFSDKVGKTFVADKKKATAMLKDRMNTAIREYHEYLEGENVKTRQ